MSAETPKPSQTGKIITAVIGALLLGGMIFFAVKYFQEKEKNEIAEVNIDDLTGEIEELEIDLDDYRAELEDANLDIEDKERLLAEKEQELIEKQKKIDRLLRTNKITQEEATRLRGKIEQMEFYIAKYQKTIEEQKREIASLQKDKKTLEERIDTVYQKMSEIEMARIKDQTKLKASSFLNAFGFRFYRIKNSGKEVEDTEFRKGKIEELKICFKIMEEPAAEAGDRDLFIQVVDAAGKVIRDTGTESGYVTANGQENAYSLKTTINFDKTTTKVCVVFKQPEGHDYDKGIHTVTVFDGVDKTDIGSGTFEVK